MSHQSNVNAGDLPNSYQPAPPVQNFAAPAHHLSTEQSKEVVALAEQSHQDTQGGFMSQNSGSGHHGGNSGLSGSGAGFGSSTTDNIASTLGGGSGSATRSHGLTGGEYERRGDDLTGNRTNLSSGTGQVGSSTYDNTSSSSHSHGLGSGAGALGAAGAGAGVYGAGHGSHGDSNARGGASAVAAKQSGRGGELTDHEFRNTAPQGTLENKLQDELERNARKAGTHATGFGVQGTPAGSSSLGSGSSGLTGNTSSSTTGAGYSTSGQQYGSQSGTGIGHHSSTSGAAPLAGAGVGAAGAGYGTSSGLTGQQGYGQQQQGYPAGASTAVGQTGPTGTGERLADQIHGLGTQRDVDVGKFGTMQDHTRKNNEF